MSPQDQENIALVFWQECHDRIQKIQIHLDHQGFSNQPKHLRLILRELHAIKGAAALVNNHEIEEYCHKLEDQAESLMQDSSQAARNDFSQALSKLIQILGDFPKEKAKSELSIAQELAPSLLIIEKFIEDLTHFDISEKKFQFPFAVFENLKQLAQREAQQKALPLINALENFSQRAVSESFQFDIKEILAAQKSCIVLSQIFAGLRAYSLREVQELAEQLEEENNTLPQAQQLIKSPLRSPSTENMGLLKMQDLGNRMGEIIENSLKDIKNLPFSDSVNLKSLQGLYQKMTTVIEKLDQHPMQNQMKKLENLISTVAISLGKKINFHYHCDNVKISSKLLASIMDILVQLIRNAGVHGIEPPEERIRLNKKEVGVINLNITHEKECLFITIQDDGNGLDIEKISERAMKLGHYKTSELAHMSDEEKAWLIFKEGLSTQKDIQLHSGRGIGLEAVAQWIKELGGNIEIENKPRKGLKIDLRLPLKVKPQTYLITQLGERKLAFPLKNVVAEHSWTKDIDENSKWKWKGNLIDLIDLNLTFNQEKKTHKNLTAKVVVLETSNITIACLIDDFLGYENHLQERLQNPSPDIQYIQGKSLEGTLLLNEKDIELLAEHHKESFKNSELSVADSALVFYSGQQQKFALPLEEVQMILPIKEGQINQKDKGLYFFHENRNLKIIQLGSNPIRLNESHDLKGFTIILQDDVNYAIWADHLETRSNLHSQMIEWERPPPKGTKKLIGREPRLVLPEYLKQLNQDLNSDFKNQN